MTTGPLVTGVSLEDAGRQVRAELVARARRCSPLGDARWRQFLASFTYEGRAYVFAIRLRALGPERYEVDYESLVEKEEV